MASNEPNAPHSEEKELAAEVGEMSLEEAERVFAEAVDRGELQVVYGDVEGGAIDSDEEALMGGDEDDDAEEGDEENDERPPLKDVHDDSVAQFRGHSDPVHSVAVSPVPVLPGGDFLVASGGQDEKTQLFGLSDGAPLDHLEQHKDTIISVQFNPTGEYLATASMDGTVQVYAVRAAADDEAKEGGAEAVKHLHTLEGPGGELEWLCWHEKGAILAAGCSDTTAWMWNARTGQMMRVFSGHSGSVLCGTFTGNGGKLLVTGGEDAKLFVWSPKTGQSQHVVSGHRFHEAPITCISAHVESPLVITGSEDTTVCVTHVESGRVLHHMKGHSSSVEAVDFCPGNKNWAISASVDCTIRMWDVNQGVCRSVMQHPNDAVICAQFLPGSVLLVSAGVEGVLRLWDARNGKLVRKWTGPQGAVHSLTASPDGKKVVLGSDDEVVRVFDLTKKPHAEEPAVEASAAAAAAAAKEGEQQ